MKISKKILILIVTLMVACIFPVAANADGVPVQLYFANSYDDYSGVAGHINGYIAIQNLSPTKNVVVHYSYDGSGIWYDVSASYLKTNSDGYEVWSFAIPSNYFGYCSFAIKYEVNGQTYWDNNGGNNYTLGIRQTVFGKSVVCSYSSALDSDIYGVESFHGTISVKNIGNPKVVTVRYTTNNWATYTDLNASYVCTSPDNGEDFWNFSVSFPTQVNQVKYAISYTVNGNTYWDNNFGSNYTLNY